MPQRRPSPPSSPSAHPVHARQSASALVLVPDDDNDDNDDNDDRNMGALHTSNSSHFELSSSDDEHDDDDHTPFRSSSSGQRAEPLSATAVALYLLAPYLKLGAMLLPDAQLPLQLGLPALFLFAALSAFSRQIWYMLARYFCTVDFETVILDVLVGKRQERAREIFRSLSRAGTVFLRTLLATIYLKGPSSPCLYAW
jgi:hypothetical protein